MCYVKRCRSLASTSDRTDVADHGFTAPLAALSVRTRCLSRKGMEDSGVRMMYEPDDGVARGTACDDRPGARRGFVRVRYPVDRIGAGGTTVRGPLRDAGLRL